MLHEAGDSNHSDLSIATLEKRSMMGGMFDSPGLVCLGRILSKFFISTSVERVELSMCQFW